MRVMFVRQLGQTGVGTVREVSAGEAEWLMGNGFCLPVDTVSIAEPAVAQVAAQGEARPRRKPR